MIKIEPTMLFEPTIFGDDRFLRAETLAFAADWVCRKKGSSEQRRWLRGRLGKSQDKGGG